jgi:hypothetical protein
MLLRLSRSRISWERGAHWSPTTWKTSNRGRCSRAHSFRNPLIAWWKNSSPGPQGLAVQSSIWPRAEACRIGSAVERSPQLMSTTRWAPRMQTPGMAQEFNSGHGRHPLVGKHQRQLPAVDRQPLQPAQPYLRGVCADHLVVGPVALAQLPSRALRAAGSSSTAINTGRTMTLAPVGCPHGHTLSGDGRVWPVAICAGSPYLLWGCLELTRSALVDTLVEFGNSKGRITSQVVSLVPIAREPAPHAGLGC